MLEGPRAAKPKELHQVIELTSWVFGCKAKGLLMDDIFPQLFNESNLENLRVMVSNGKVISHVGVWEGWLNLCGCWVKVGLVGAVCTHPDYRRRGYASALVRDAFMKMLGDRVDLVMVSGVRTLYSRVGCVEAGIVYEFTVEADKFRRMKNVEVKPYEENVIQELASLYQREPVRFKRSLEEFRLLIGRRILEAGASLRVLVSYRKDKPIAYVALLDFKTGWALKEYAGFRAAVLHTLREASERLGFRSIRLDIPYGDWELFRLLEEHGFKPRTSRAPASLAIPDPVGFADKISPYVKEQAGREASFRVETTGGFVRVYLLRESLELKDHRAFTLLLFGRPRTVVNPDTPSFNLEDAPEVFRRVFPMPTPVYGLNYI